MKVTKEMTNALLDDILGLKNNVNAVCLVSLLKKLLSINCHAIFFALRISLFPGGPGSLSTVKPAASMALLTAPLAQ